MIRFKRGTAMPRPRIQALRKPLGKDVETTAPRYSAETVISALVPSFEVSQASYTQDEDITPLIFIHKADRTTVRMQN